MVNPDSQFDRPIETADLSPDTSAEDSPISTASDFSLSEERTWAPDYSPPEQGEEPQFRGKTSHSVAKAQEDLVQPPIVVDPPVHHVAPVQAQLNNPSRRPGVNFPVVAALPRAATPPIPVPGEELQS